MKKNIIILSLMLLALFTASYTFAKEAVLVLPVQAPAFVDIEQGIKEKLPEDITLRVILASDYKGKPGGIIQASLQNNPMVLLPLGTKLSQAYLSNLSGIENSPPIIGIAVTNPADVLGKDTQPPRSHNITIIKDAPAQIYPNTAGLIEELYPNTAVVGTVYNQSEANSISNKEQITKNAKNKGWNVIEKAINSPEDIELVAKAFLQEKPDVVWIGKDRLMTSMPGYFIELLQSNGIPVFASDSGTVEGFNALATHSVSFRQFGNHVAKAVIEVDNGELASNMPVSTVQNTNAYLSESALSLLGLKLPKKLQDTAIVFKQEKIENLPAGSSNLGLLLFLVFCGILALFLYFRLKK